MKNRLKKMIEGLERKNVLEDFFIEYGGFCVKASSVDYVGEGNYSIKGSVSGNYGFDIFVSGNVIRAGHANTLDESKINRDNFMELLAFSLKGQ